MEFERKLVIKIYYATIEIGGDRKRREKGNN